MFQFDEDWDPEEERRDQEEYRRVLQAHGQQQQQVDNQKRDGNEQPRSSSFYDDYFALDPAQLMPATSSSNNNGNNNNIPNGGTNAKSAAILHFVEQPQSEWIVRSRPAQLSCTAVNARRIRVKCNAKWLDERRVRLEHGLDPSSGHPTLRAHADIQRAELDAWLADLGEFACQCWAFGDENAKVVETADVEDSEDEEDDEEEEDDDGEDNTGPSTSKPLKKMPATVRSDTARIRLAYLRKHFHQVPIPQRVHEGRTVQLQCQPPDGDPKPEVFWHKDGQQLHFPSSADDPRGTSQNLILAGDGSLILSAARLSDSGNYTCEARNPANRRFTDAAEIAVYVDGDWSPWSQWEGDCARVLLDCPVLQSQLAMVRGDPDAVQRVLPRQRRTRACNNPAPLNAGRGCQGAAEEFRECDHECRLDGAWTQWGPWARQCDAQCRRERRRECSGPAPANGGNGCHGTAQQWRNCTDDSDSTERLPIAQHCLPGAAPLVVGPQSAIGFSTIDSSSPSTPSARPLFDSQLLALASLGCVAFLLLVIMMLGGLLFCARRKRAKAQTGAAHCGAGIFLDREEKLYFPGAAVAATAEDELGNVRTVLLDQKLLDSLGPSPAHYGPTGTPGNGGLPRFFSLKPGQGTPLMGGGLHPTVSTPPARLASFLQSPNSYTLRSWTSRNGQPVEGVQPYASGPIVPRAGSRGKHHQQQHQDVAGSRVALLPEYSSSSQGSNRTGQSQRHCSAGHHRDEENNYATLYEELGRTVAASTESMADSSGPDYALSRGSSSAGTRPIGGGSAGADGGGGGPTFVAVEVNQESARIELRRSGAALTIGDGTFQTPCTLYLSVSDDAADRPELQEGETWLSSTVSFGQCDQQPLLLERPVVLSVEHCASLFPKEHCWHFSVWAQLDQSDQWTKAWEESSDGDDANFGLHLDRQRWHLLTRRSGRFLLVGRQRRAHVAAQKRVHLFAYWTPPSIRHFSVAPPPPPRPDRPCYDSVPIGTIELAQIRVYCVPETSMAVEGVRQQEKQRMGGLLLAEAENFLLQTRGPLCCCLEQIGFPGGEGHPTDGSQYLEIPEQLHRWCAQNGLHFQLNVSGLPSTPNSPMLPRSLQGRIVLYQKGNAADRQLLSFCLDADQPSHQTMGREDSELSRLSAMDSTPLELLTFSRFQLPTTVRTHLAQLLEESDQGNGDWQALAKQLGMQQHIAFLAAQPMAALCLLELWEAVNAGSERALLDLLQTLRVLGRPDAVQLLELCLAQGGGDPSPPSLGMQQCPPAPFCSLNVSPEESRHELARMQRAVSE